MGVRHHHGRQGAAAAGAGTGDIMGRLAWRHGRSRAPFRPWRAVHRPRVHHQGRGIRHASLDRHGRRLVRQRHGRERRRRVQDRARLATQALPGFEGPGIGDVPVGLVVELEASAPVLGLQDTGTDRNRVLCKPSGASRPIIRVIRAEQKSGHISEWWGNEWDTFRHSSGPAAFLTMENYLIKQIDGTSWQDNFLALMDKYPQIPINNMGFPENWRSLPLWQ